MTAEWRKTTIGEILENDGGHIKTGPFGTVLKAAEYSTAGKPVVSVGEVGFGRIEIGPRTPRVPPQVTRRLSEYLLREGDIVFGRKGAVERSARVTAEQDGWFLGSDGIRLRLPTSCDSQFIAYHFQTQTHRDWMIQHSTGTTMASLNQKIIERIPVLLPPLSEQRAIARILCTFDDKIELNRKTNATLEAMARALFQSWFVDFDPVRAKVAGRSLHGMDAATAALFPDGFEVAEGREVPRGWCVQGLDEIATYLNGLALQKYPADGPESLPVIKIAQLRKDSAEDADRASTDVPSACIVDDGDVLFSWSGSLEVSLWCGGRGALNQHLFKVSSPTYPKWFYYLWTRHHLSDFQHTAAGKATTMGHIQRHHLSDAKAYVPPPDLLVALDRVFSPLIDKIVSTKVNTRTLAVLRDTLLPKLLSGELRVPEALRVVEEVV